MAPHPALESGQTLLGRWVSDLVGSKRALGLPNLLAAPPLEISSNVVEIGTAYFSFFFGNNVDAPTCSTIVKRFQPSSHCETSLVFLMCFRMSQWITYYVTYYVAHYVTYYVTPYVASLELIIMHTVAY